MCLKGEVTNGLVVGCRKALLRDVAPHVKEHYPSSPAFGVYPVQDDAGVAVVVVGNKYSPSNYWLVLPSFFSLLTFLVGS